MPSERLAPAQLQPIALTAQQVGELLGIDASTVRRNSAAGVMPGPVKVGAAVRWIRAELVDWCAARCPAESEWTWPAEEVERGPRLASRGTA